MTENKFIFLIYRVYLLSTNHISVNISRLIIQNIQNYNFLNIDIRNDTLHFELNKLIYFLLKNNFKIGIDARITIARSIYTE